MKRPFRALRSRPPRPSYDAVIVGSGIGGLLCANLLARGCLNCHTNIHGTNNPASISNERTFRR